MFRLILRNKSLFLILLFSLIITLIKVGFWLDPRTKIVFCNVGQGDASYIRVKNKIDILIDAGPNRQVLNCLGKHMPFWDKKIEIAFISHPQKDHFGGYLSVLDRYKVERLFITPLKNPSLSFAKLLEKIKNKKIKVLITNEKTSIDILNDRLIFLWPTTSFLEKNLYYAKKDNPSANVLGESTIDDNHFSQVFLFQENNFSVLYTGDASPLVLNSLSNQSKNLLKNNKLNILKIPHHGSKNGLTKKFLELANPDIALISVGKNNPYGHPAKEILDMLKAKKIKIKRTDINGDVVFKIN